LAFVDVAIIDLIRSPAVGIVNGRGNYEQVVGEVYLYWDGAYWRHVNTSESVVIDTGIGNTAYPWDATWAISKVTQATS
jgi:hypothetical protein